MMKRFVLLLCLVVLAFPALAQEETGLPMVGNRDGQLIYIDETGAETVLLEEYGGFDWQAPQWLTFQDEPAVAVLNTATYVLHIFALDGTETTFYLNQPAFDFPVTFSEDGTQVYYVTEEGAVPSEDTPLIRRQVVVQALQAGATPTLIGESTYGAGCGGGSSYPMYSIRNQEIGYTANPKVFVLTDYGLAYSADCLGNGVNLLDLETGDNFQLVDMLYRVVLSPDGQQLAGTSGMVDAPSQSPILLNIYNIETDSLESIQTAEAPDQIAWSPLGDALFYSTRIEGEPFLPELTDAQQAQLDENVMGQFEDGIPSFDVAIRRYDLATGEDTFVASFDSWGVGRMFPVDDQLYVSVIPDGSAWIEALATSTLEPDDFEAIDAMVADTVQPQLNVINLRDGDVEALGQLMTFTPWVPMDSAGQ